MSTPAQLNFTARTNADFFAVVQFQSGAAPVDITGSDAHMTVQDFTGATCLVLTLADGLTLDAVNGKVSILVPAARMAGLKPGQYVYDLQLRRGNGISVPVAGTIQIASGVSRV